MKKLNLRYTKPGLDDFTKEFDLTNLLASAIDYPGRTAVTLNIRGHQIAEFIVTDYTKAYLLASKINEKINLGNSFSFIIDFDS